MTLEDTLNSLGDEPISNSENYVQILAYLNGNLKRFGIDPIKPSIPANEILTLIYSLTDIDVQTTLLNKNYKKAKSKDSYPTVIIGFTSIIAVIVLGTLFLVVKTDSPLEGDSAALLQSISNGIINLLKIILQ